MTHGENIGDRRMCDHTFNSIASGVLWSLGNGIIERVSGVGPSSHHIGAESEAKIMDSV